MHRNSIIVFLVCIVLSAFTGCTTTTGRGVDKSVIEHQKQLVEYQAGIQYYLGRIDAGAEQIRNIRNRAESLGGKIDQVIELFDDYNRAVEQLLRDYNNLRNQFENRESEDKTIGYMRDNIDVDNLRIVMAVLENKNIVN